MTPILNTIRSAPIREQAADLPRKHTIAHIPSLLNASDNDIICSLGTTDAGNNSSKVDYKSSSNNPTPGELPSSFNEYNGLTSSLGTTLSPTPQSARSDNRSRSPRLSASASKILWHKDISYAIASGKWENIRGHLALQASYRSAGSFSPIGSDENINKKKSSGYSFWSRISGTKPAEERDQTGLLAVDTEQQTPLHVLLTSRKTPVDVITLMVDVEPRACSKVNSKGRLPLHYAVVHRHSIEIISKLIDSYPAAISMSDSKNQSPLSYAFDIAKKETILHKAPPTFWMSLPDDCTEGLWQQEQAERWGVVHWLLLSSATHPQTTLSVGGKKPMLVEALFHAASPAVISLLIGASVMLLSYENKATAFAGSTLYTCITRHYPLTILISLASQCSKDVRKIRDETGLGLVSAQYISGCFEQMSSLLQQQLVNQTEPPTEWRISDDFYSCFLECMQEGSLGEDPALTDWWKKVEFLLAFCSEYDYRMLQRDFLLHVALLNTDVPPAVIRMLLALYPQSVSLPWSPSLARKNCTPEQRNKTSHNNIKSIVTRREDIADDTAIISSNSDAELREKALPLHLAAMTTAYIPRYYERDVADRETVLDIVFNANRSVIRKRYDKRLPLHFAIGSGRLYLSLSPLIQNDLKQLLERDPKTKLFPFLQAASYNNQKDEDGYRWSCIARNQYTHSEWRNLSDRNKAAAVLKVAELEDIGRVETCYQLLRLQPGVLHLCCGYDKNTNLVGMKSRGSNASISRHQSKVSSHYLHWSYTYNEIASEWLVNSANQNLFQEAIQCATSSGSLLALPSTFDAFWTQLLFWIKRCCPIELPSMLVSLPCDMNGPGEKAQHDEAGVELIEIRAIVDSNPEFLLHATLASSDTPPKVIQLLTKLYPRSVTAAVPNTAILPLHIAAHTMSYAPRPYEVLADDNTLLHVLNENRSATRQLCNGFLPLHIAVLASKPLHEIKMLVDAEPRALAVCDCKYHLLPYQLMAMRRTYTSEQRLHFQSIARNSFSDDGWSRMTPHEQTKKYRKARQHHHLNTMSCIFELLRRNPALIKRSELNAPGTLSGTIMLSKVVKATMDGEVFQDTDESSTTDESQNKLGLVSIQVEAGQVSMSHISVSDADETEISDEHGAEHNISIFCSNSARDKVPIDGDSSQSSFAASYGITPRPGDRQSSLMQLLSQKTRNSYAGQKVSSDDMFECDASVFSTVDVMSTLSSTLHTLSSSKKNLPYEHPSDEKYDDDGCEESIHIDMFGMNNIVDDDDSIYDDGTEAKSSDSKENHTPRSLINDENRLASIEKIAGENDSCDSEDSMVVFSLRRRPRLFYRKESNAAAPAVKLMRKPNSTLAAMAKPLPSSNDSVDHRGPATNDGQIVDSVTSSYKTLQNRTSTYRSTDAVQHALNNSQWTYGDESSLTMDSSCRTTKEVPSFRRAESRNSLLSSSRKSKKSSLVVGGRSIIDTTSKAGTPDVPRKGDTTLLGDMQDSSHTNDDDFLLMVRRNSISSPVSSINTYTTSHKESPESKISLNPSLLVKRQDSDDSSSKDILDLMTPYPVAPNNELKQTTPRLPFVVRSEGGTSDNEHDRQDETSNKTLAKFQPVGLSEIICKSKDDESLSLVNLKEARSIPINGSQQPSSQIRLDASAHSLISLPNDKGCLRASNMSSNNSESGQETGDIILEFTSNQSHKSRISMTDAAVISNIHSSSFTNVVESEINEVGAEHNRSKVEHYPAFEKAIINKQSCISGDDHDLKVSVVDEAALSNDAKEDLYSPSHSIEAPSIDSEMDCVPRASLLSSFVGSDIQVIDSSKAMVCGNDPNKGFVPSALAINKELERKSNSNVESSISFVAATSVSTATSQSSNQNALPGSNSNLRSYDHTLSSETESIKAQGSPKNSLVALGFADKNYGQEVPTMLESTSAVSAPVDLYDPPTPVDPIRDSADRCGYVSPNNSLNRLNGTKISFDKKAFKWINITPPSESITKLKAMSSETEETNAGSGFLEIGNSQSAKANHDAKLSANDMYFDKDSMRWRKRSESTVISHGKDSRNKIISSDSHGFFLEKPKKQKQVKLKKEIKPKALIPSPTKLDNLGLEECSSTSKSLSAEHALEVGSKASLYSGENRNGNSTSRFGRKSSTSIPAKTPNDRELRSQWATMFN